MISCPGGLRDTQCLVLTSRLHGQDVRGLLARHGHWLSRVDREHIDRQQDALTRNQMILARLLLRRALCALTGEDEADFEFSNSEYGKPQLCHRTFCTNVSHSGDHVAIALAHRAVGVDVETSHALKDGNQDAPFWGLDRAFSADERSDMARLTKRDRRRRLLEIWTWKEAVMKCDGRGFALDPAKFCMVTQSRPLGVLPMVANCHWIADDASLGLAYRGRDITARICTLERFPTVQMLRDPAWLDERTTMLPLRTGCLASDIPGPA